MRGCTSRMGLCNGPGRGHAYFYRTASTVLTVKQEKYSDSTCDNKRILRIKWPHWKFRFCVCSFSHFPHRAVDFSLPVWSVAVAARTVAPVAVMHGEAGQARPGRTRRASYSVYVILQKGAFNFGAGAAAASSSECWDSLSLLLSLPPAAVCVCVWTCALWGYFHPFFGSGRQRAAVVIMGDVQSTQRGSRQDAAAEEQEGREVDSPQTEQNTEHKVGRRTRAVLFYKVMLWCVTEVLGLLVLGANSSINLKTKQRIGLII